MSTGNRDDSLRVNEDTESLKLLFDNSASDSVKTAMLPYSRDVIRATLSPMVRAGLGVTPSPDGLGIPACAGGRPV